MVAELLGWPQGTFASKKMNNNLIVTILLFNYIILFSTVINKHSLVNGANCWLVLIYGPKRIA
ncbi:hypothetical protein SLEP1_g53495 [Rubroshorea leprosula]|uniref:Uncharacterized protein n=2 Tax=Rubroshorea leprosula TaxID=152421 RepID=A0AAV5MBC7_9ROSI|nr:hypothetical protein SLEP1_g53495 [Rubroshorea leprosula]